MDITFKKKIEDLEKEISLKSIDFDEDSHSFNIEITKYDADYIVVTISPECARCNICYEVCPVDAIESSTSIKRAIINENCVDCEICAQSCPIKAINVVNADVSINDHDVEYKLTDVDIPHRKIKLKSIEVLNEKCAACGTCVKFCPSSAITLKETDHDNLVNKFGEKIFAHVNESICIGCGACANVCNENAINVEREIGSLIKTKDLLVDQETCVECLVCEESCPVEAIKLKDGKIVLDKEKCILCDVCSNNCPVGALELKRL